MADKICGIYCIENLVNGKKYIGQSIDIHKRLKEHLRNYDLDSYDKTNGENRHLWFSVKKHGIDSFQFIVLEICGEEALDDREEFYIIELKSHETENGYNVLYRGFSRRGVHHTDETKKKISSIHTGKKITEETRKKMSEARKGRKHSEETKTKISKTKIGTQKGENNPNFGKRGENSIWWGKKHSKETITKMSHAKLGKHRSIDTINKLKEIKGNKHWVYGRKLTKKERDKMSFSMIGVKKKTSHSIYKGVSFYSKINKYKASITINRKSVYLGIFELETDAAKKYDCVCWENYKDLSKLNFPEDYEKGDDK